MEALKTTHYTFEEYLNLEENSELRHEYFYGEIFAMAGTTRVHNELTFNTTARLKDKLKGERCFVYLEAVKVEIKKSLHYTYPDVVVSCSEKEDDDKSIKFPILIVEVLSDSTRKYDINEKFSYYKELESLKHYVLIEQEKYFVTVFTKHNDLWVHKAYSKLEEMVDFEHLNIKIPVKEIYENISFEENKQKAV